MVTLTMSRKELSRVEWLVRVKQGEMSLRAASVKMKVSYRQAKRMWQRYRVRGEAGLVHGLRGMPSNRQVDGVQRQRVLQLYQEKYPGFGVTLAAECLLEEDEIAVPVETLRTWLKQEGLWQRRRKSQPHRSWRPRRERSGELVQIDGSPHDWFEGRGPKAVLMEMVDDATGRTLSRFYEEETTEAAMDLFARYVAKDGLPQALYSDHDSIYETSLKTSTEEALRGEGPVTQFGRAMKELGVHIILANSPQAKGRVERRHGVMQDRLIKMMRLKKINDIDSANRFLDGGFLAKENLKFVKKASCPKDGHRQVPKGIDLRVVLSIQEERVVQNDWTVVWQNRWFQLGAMEQKQRLVKKKVQVCRLLDGAMRLQYRGRELQWKELPQRPARVKVAKPKLVASGKPVRKPRADHPWRKTRAVV
jgi:transposase